MPPTTETNGWVTAYYRLAKAAVTNPDCKLCRDTGFCVPRISQRYSRGWLQPCTSCPKGRTVALPSEYGYEDCVLIPAVRRKTCAKCDSTGWVWTSLVKNEVVRCQDCKPSAGHGKRGRTTRAYGKRS